MMLFLHGLGGHGAEWSSTTACLAACGRNSDSILTPDLRGHGTAAALGANRGAGDQLVDDAIALIDAGASPMVIVGQSIGGVIATLAAAARPQQVAALVLVETGMAALVETEAIGVERWFTSWSAGFADRDAATAFFGDDAPSTPAWVAGLDDSSGRLMPRFSPATMTTILRGLTGADRWGPWRDLTMPTLVVRGSQGTIADGDIDEMMRLRPRVELRVIDESGHDLHLDQPAALAATIDRFLNRIGC